METKETVTTEVVNLSNRNEKLCQELTEIDQLAQRLERHKEQVLETADKELGEAKVTSGTELSPGGGRAGLREGGRESHAQLWGLLCGGSVYAFSDRSPLSPSLDIRNPWAVAFLSPYSPPPFFGFPCNQHFFN